jgi:predicted DsbA family dithiol-disulfide isomerase
MERYTAHMAALGAAENLTLDFSAPGGGVIANSLPALRILLHLQSAVSPAAAHAALASLYASYFSHHQHPSSAATLRAACVAAGLDDAEAERVVGDEVGLDEVQRAVQRQAADGVDAVPWVVVEGRRRDFTLVGAKEIREYEKVLADVVREAA